MKSTRPPKQKLPMLTGGTAVRFCSRRKAWDEGEDGGRSVNGKHLAVD
jgi:hypothetical protein